MNKFNDAELIEYVRQFACLWDSRLSEYKNSKMKENAWTTISEILHVTVEICHSRWLALRQRYVKEKREGRHVPSGSGTSGGTQWHLFQDMEFLDRIVKQRRTAGNISKTLASPITSPSIPLVVETSTPPVSPWDSLSEMLVIDSPNYGEDIPSCRQQSEVISVVPSPSHVLKEKKRKLETLREEIPMIKKKKSSSDFNFQCF